MKNPSKAKRHSKNSIKKRVAENALIIGGLAKKLDLTPQEVAVKISNGEIKLR